MRLTIYVIFSPEYPDRAMTSTTMPTPERARALRAQGCEIWRVNTEIPTHIDWTGSFFAPAKPLKYLGQKVTNTKGVVGVVCREEEKCVYVDWGDRGEGQFSLEAFDDGRLKLVEEAPDMSAGWRA